MFFRWCGGCGSKTPGLMNMLEAQNTLSRPIYIASVGILDRLVDDYDFPTNKSIS